MKVLLTTCCAIAALTSPLACDAAAEPDLARLEERIRVLEESASVMQAQAEEALAALRAAQAEIDQLKAAGAEPVLAAAEPVDSGGGGNPNAFNPAISFILEGSYAHHSLDPDRYERSGFPLAGEAGPGSRGLSLGESELALSSNIDDKFYGQLIVAAESEDGEDELAIEEAYIDTTALPAGFTVRAGRFFSNIGYLNNHHTHTDKFPDRPLAYQAFLGNQYGDDGVQLRWVAPTDTFVEVGGELLRGEKYPAGGASHQGVGAWTVFAHAGGDVGIENSWLAGISLLHSDTEGGEDGFTGDGNLYIADLTWKWAPDGNTKDGGVQLRTEWFLDDRDGQYVDAEDPALDQLWNGTRRGAYVEAVYRINRNWETGYRYDKLWADDTGPVASDFDPYRHGAMLAWRNSEFSLIRLLFSRDRPNSDDTDNVLLLQYQAALGAHGAHKF
jgi:hypothetical protein